MKNPTNDDAYDVLFCSYELANKQIKEMQAQLAAAQADIKILQANVSYQMERNRNNVANAQLQIDELTSEYQTWREACGKARERADAAADEITRLRAEMQAMVVKLTALAEEWAADNTWSEQVDGTLKHCAGRLREAIGRGGEKWNAKNQ